MAAGDRLAVLDLMMLLYFGEARQRTMAEYSELFRATGLECSRVVSPPSAFSIVEERPFDGATVRTEPPDA